MTDLFRMLCELHSAVLGLDAAARHPIVISDDARKWLTHVTGSLLQLMLPHPEQKHQPTPSEVVAAIPAVLGITPTTIAELRHSRNVHNIGMVFQLEKMNGEAKVEWIVADLAARFNVSPATVYRLGKEAEPAFEQLIRTRTP